MSDNALTLVGSAARKLVWSIFNRPYTPSIDGGIASLERVNLGGYDQWCLIRGRNPEAPILLFLHGGPGSPDMTIHRYYNSELENDFIVVYWDQWGSGKSFAETAGTKREMTIDAFVNDAHELILNLQDRFCKERVFVIGHSWGSVIGMKLVSKYPEDVEAYIGMGQVVNIPESERIGFDFALESALKAGNLKAIRALEKVGPPVDGEYRNGLKGLKIQRNWVLNYGGAIHRSKNYNSVIRPLFTASEYSFGDIIGFLRGMDFSLRGPLWGEIVTSVDFRRDVTEVKVPVYFFAGRFDYQTAFELVQEYFNALKAPHKELIWFDDSAHMPCFEEPARFQSEVVARLLRPASH